MADPWGFSTEVASLGLPGGVITLVEGSSFCISGRSGDVRADSPQGFFFHDTRLLSESELCLDGKPLEPLSVTVDDPNMATFVTRSRPEPGEADSNTVVFRNRYLGEGLREDITILNFSQHERTYKLDLLLKADFADVFEVKEGRVARHAIPDISVTDECIVVHNPDDLEGASVRLRFDREVQITSDNHYSFEATIAPGKKWRLAVELTPQIGGVVIGPRYALDTDVETALPTARMHQWRRAVPAIRCNYEPLQAALHRGLEDLGALRIFDESSQSRPVVAAGAPWFMGLFGRDSLIASWSALMVDPDLALGVLETLARYQGTKIVEETEEQPGRILHEMRFGSARLMLGGHNVYYGSIDSTPLFVMLLGELRRWGLAPGFVNSLLPHADRALEWIETYGDRDGDGFIEYEKLASHGLNNQGWKDSNDGIRFADGRIAKAPIALCEVQAYVYGAYQARIHFAVEDGDTETADKYRQKAAALKEAFNRDFWIADGEYFAMGLDGDKKPIDAVASNMGHALWTGIIDEKYAPAVARHLTSSQMFSGWGIRTLSSEMVGFNPLNYHCGSVWPHDSAISAAGLMRYGFVEGAQKIARGLLEASVSDGGRLPEVFSGLKRKELSQPIPFPTSCSPQAWAAASPALLLRTLLRFEPQVPENKIHLSPQFFDELRYLRIERVPLGGSRIAITFKDGEVDVEGLPSHIKIESEPRAPVSAAPEG